MSDGTCPTVKVKSDNEQGYTMFDAHAFNPDTQELYTEPSDLDISTQPPDSPTPTPAPKAKGK